jgi:hypothetical protein
MLVEIKKVEGNLTVSMNASDLLHAAMGEAKVKEQDIVPILVKAADEILKVLERKSAEENDE